MSSGALGPGKPVRALWCLDVRKGKVPVCLSLMVMSVYTMHTPARMMKEADGQP